MDGESLSSISVSFSLNLSIITHLRAQPGSHKCSLSEKRERFSMHLLSIVEIYQLSKFLVKSVNAMHV